MIQKLLIREMEYEDCSVIACAFKKQRWNKPLEQFRNYYRQQAEGIRKVLVSEGNGEFAGYLTILWQSKYPPFREKNIPEISDFNVLKKFRRQGVGTKLMDVAESLVAESSTIVGLGVGLTADYGDALHLYLKRGYIPDGRGISQSCELIKYGDRVMVDDNLNLYLIKELIQA
jgi:GNAT superfamily N-acetyltransferase